jgi:starch synthase
MHIAMIAAENGALTGGKVGGIGDVIRDVPLALAALGHQVSVITPGYQSLTQRNPSRLLGAVDVAFCGRVEQVDVFKVEPAGGAKPAARRGKGAARAGEVVHYVLEHPLFGACGAGAIYCNDHFGPFATDAHKFSLFCVAVCQVLIEQRIGGIEQLHLHDWHAAMLAILRRYLPQYRALRALPTVFSIHNLSLQGVRPLSGDGSSLHSWFPELVPDLGRIQDPAHWDCVNLMRAGITLSDRVHAVSPNYAREILIPTDLAHGFIGGEGLENDLQAVQAEGRLIGILNGCDYRHPPAPHRTRVQLLDLIENSLLEWVGERHNVPAAHFHAQRQVAHWRKRRKPVSSTLTSVGRVTGQKARLFLEPVSDGKGGECSALDKLLTDLRDGVFIMIGSGEEHFEHFFTAAMTRHDNFLFLRGFSETLAEALYAAGDLFLMPSSFEPCGISQMLAMRAGTPCIVHHVGGLRDTVIHGSNGFAFTGATPRAQAEAMLDSVRLGCATMARPAAWAALRKGALATRFTWDDVVRRYVSELYSPRP